MHACHVHREYWIPSVPTRGALFPSWFLNQTEITRGELSPDARESKREREIDREGERERELGPARRGKKFQSECAKSNHVRRSTSGSRESAAWQTGSVSTWAPFIMSRPPGNKVTTNPSACHHASPRLAAQPSLVLPSTPLPLVEIHSFAESITPVSPLHRVFPAIPPAISINRIHGISSVFFASDRIVIQLSPAYEPGGNVGRGGTLSIRKPMEWNLNWKLDSFLFFFFFFFKLIDRERRNSWVSMDR